MKITEIAYSKSEKRMIAGDYEPTEIWYSAKAELKEGDNIEDAYTELKSIVNELVRKDVVALKAGKETKQELGF